jgi:hypothetical protein
MNRPGGGRTWWAQFEFTRINIDVITTSTSTRPVGCTASTLAALGLKEAEMRLIACDLHARQQSIAMLDRDTGAVIEKTVKHDGDAVVRCVDSAAGRNGSLAA